MTEYKKKRKFPKKEGNFLKEFMEEFTVGVEPKPWHFKVHGEPMQVRGVPDIIMSYKGLFVGIEFKIMRAGKLTLTPYQNYVSELIQKSGGLAFVVWYDENTSNVGIGTKRFLNKTEAVKLLKETLDFLGDIRPNKSTITTI